MRGSCRRWGDGAFPAPPGRVTLRGLGLARNSSVAARAGRVGVGRPGGSGPRGPAAGRGPARGRRRAPGKSRCRGLRGRRGRCCRGAPHASGSPVRGGGAGESVRESERGWLWGGGPRSPGWPGARPRRVCRPGRWGMSSAAAWPLFWCGSPGSPGLSPCSVFCSVFRFRPVRARLGWKNSRCLCRAYPTFTVSLNFLVSDAFTLPSSLHPC